VWIFTQIMNYFFQCFFSYLPLWTWQSLNHLLIKERYQFTCLL
jgi:hypothetical protein